MSSFCTVITTIQSPTPSVRALHNRLAQKNGLLVVAGDKKGPAGWDLPDSVFLGLADQLESGFLLAKQLPINHYARKNIGYLKAIQLGAKVIYETDDDNAPLESWDIRKEHLSACRVLDPSGQGWVNVYRCFTGDAQIWPRGFPLDAVCAPVPETVSDSASCSAPIQQGLVNGSADVDAVWRLTQDRPFEFDSGLPVLLSPGQWCPFNTQSTWWWPAAYPLMYVPSYCSFRMCDIWKSFIAQRCLWAMDSGVVFHPPEVVQDRNPHDYMKDFHDEIPGYLQNRRIADLLDSVSLREGPESTAENLRACYDVLIREEIFPEAEAALVDAWLQDVKKAMGEGNG